MLESPSEYELAGLDEPERTEAIKCGCASCNACLQTPFSSAGVQAKQESRIADQQSKCVWKFE
nr:hypothetical protein [Candidatus Sigynarchaeota archaeon]